MKDDVNMNRTKNILRNICISTVVLFFGIILIAKAFIIELGRESVLYTYNISRNVIYNVHLMENSYFEKQEQEMNKAYVSSLVDNINMDCIYSFSGNKKSDTKYIYQVVAITNIRYSDSQTNEEKPIWSKQDVILEPKELTAQNSSFVIKENFDLDYQKYNQEVKEFKQGLKIPISADLQVKIVVRVESKVPGVEDTVIENSIMNMQMDLNKDVFNIESNYKNTDSKSITEKTETVKTVNKPNLIIGCIFIIGAVMIILASIRKSIKFSKKSDYAIALNRILKNYGDIVAEIVSPVEIDNLNVIEVKNFDQLLDIEEELRMPILFYEIIEGQQGEFIIVCDNMAYRYVIGK